MIGLLLLINLICMFMFYLVITRRNNSINVKLDRMAAQYLRMQDDLNALDKGDDGK